MTGVYQWLWAQLKVKNIKPKNYQFFVMMNNGVLIGLIAHALFIGVFLGVGIIPLALFNGLSLVIYLISFSLNRKGYHHTAQAIGSLEVIFHAIIAVRYLGWQSGFHYYMFLNVMIAYYSPRDKRFLKRVVLLLSCSSYIGLHAYMSRVHPIEPLKPMIVNLLNYMNISTLLICIALLTNYYRLGTKRAEKKLEQANAKLTYLANTDPLTNLSNRRNMLETIRNYEEISNGTKAPYTVVLCDIDDFKKFNDMHGHDCGDIVLQTAAKLMQDTLGERGKIARWGGEEFLIFIPEVNEETSMLIVEKIRTQIAQQSFCYNGVKMGITMTFGMVNFEKDIDIKTSLNKADEALLHGKKAGKNCIINF